MSLPSFVYLVLWFVCAAASSASAAEGGAATRISAHKCAEYTDNWCPDTGDLYKKHPYVVAVKLAALSNSSDQIWGCAGTLISERYVLTPAHCAKNKLEMIIASVKMGKPSVAGGLQERGVQRVLVHPQYSSRTHYNDIALIELASPVTITDYVRPVCLHQSQTLTATTGTEPAWIIKPEEHGIMKEAKILFPQKETCRETYEKSPGLEQGISDSMICASYEDVKSECVANTGVPLVVSAGECKVKAAGILSFGTFCGVGLPVVYSNIGSYLDWIEGVVWPRQPSPYSPGEVWP